MVSTSVRCGLGLIVFAFAALCPWPAHAEPVDQERVLADLRAKASAVVSIRSAFTQTTNIPMFAEPVVSRGRFLFKRPDALRWEYTQPIREGFAIRGGAGFRWEEKEDRRTAFTPGTDPVATLVARQLLDWITLDEAKIRREYNLEVIGRDPVRLRVRPLRQDVRSVIAALELTFTPDGVASMVELHEQQGGTTQIRFEDAVINSVMDDKEFQ